MNPSWMLTCDSFRKNKIDLGDPVVYFVVVLEQFDGNVFGKFNIGKFWTIVPSILSISIYSCPMPIKMVRCLRIWLFA